MRIAIHAFITLAVLCVQVADSDNVDEMLFCRIKVGDHSKELLVGMSPSEFRVFQDGTFSSKSSKYARENRHLVDGVKISTVPFGESRLTITNCRDIDNKVLVLDVTIEGNGETISQHCYVNLLPKTEKLKTAYFDCALTIMPAKTKSIPIKFEIDGGPTPILAAVENKVEGEYDTGICTTRGDKCTFPDGIRPTVTVEFPSSDPKKPIKKEYELYGFC
jgi:hypothetical protein